MTGVVLTADQSTGSRAQDNGKDQSWPRAAADSQGIAPAELDAYACFQGGPVLANRSVASQLFMGNGNGPVARVFTRQSAAQLRPYRSEPIGKESGARYAAVAESGPLSDVLVDLHGVKAPGETTRA
jgi:hypothetical protein